MHSHVTEFAKTSQRSSGLNLLRNAFLRTGSIIKFEKMH